jgi:hypothetical protein
LPRELGLDEAPGSQALESLDDLQVGDVELLVLGCIEVFFGDENTLCRKICWPKLPSTPDYCDAPLKRFS